MGCSGSKEEKLPLVVRCRERRDLIRAAVNHRYALAAAHASYFRSLKDVGDALRKFVDEELITASPYSSSFSSPSLTLPSSSKKTYDNDDVYSFHLRDDRNDNDEEESHLHLSDSYGEDEDSEVCMQHHHNHHYGHDSDDELHQHHKHHYGHDSDDELHQHHKHHGHVHMEKRAEDEVRQIHNDDESLPHYPRDGFYDLGGAFFNDPFANPFRYPYPTTDDRWNPPGVLPSMMRPSYYSSNSNVYYMKKPAPAAKSVVQDPPAEPAYGYSDSYWNSRPGYGGNYGYSSMGSPLRMGGNEGAKLNSKEAPPPPTPKASAWDFFNPFDVFDNGSPGYYSSGRYGYGSNYSSPDSSEVREREGIPDLEEETENEVYKGVLNGSRMKAEVKKSSGESSPRSRAAPLRRKSEASSRSVPPHRSEGSSAPLRRSENSSKSVPLHTREGSSRPLHTSEGSSKSVPLRRSEVISKSDPSNESEGYSRSFPLHNVDSNSKSLPSWSSVESEKPSMTLQCNGGSAKPWTGPWQSEESAKPSMSPPHGRGTSWEDQSSNLEMPGSVSLTDEKISTENMVLKSVDEGSVKKKGVTFDVEGTSKQNADSSKVSRVTLLSPRGTRDLREAVAEIRDEFETASSYGKEIAVMLEVGKLPYQPSFLKVVSRLLYLIFPSMSLRDRPSKQSAKLATNMKLERSYFEDVGKDVNLKACNLSSTLDKLYAWEKKLYKEVKDEEKHRVIYEKQCKRLQVLDEAGAEPTKINAARASVGKLLTELDVCIRAINAISRRIHKLRDEELQPRVAELINGLTRMWKAMLKCHQKQFQAMMESKMRKLRANIPLQTDSSSRATTELERELHAWCKCFNDWIGFQKSYVESLNGWLLRCLQYEPEETPDGLVPYSPGRLGAPPIFIICNDWRQAMEAISEARVANAMNAFAANLRQLWEKQDEEGRQRLKAEYLSKDYEKHLRSRHMEKGKMECEQDAMSDKTGLSVIPSDCGVSKLDDLKVDLDSVRERLAEERIKHKDAMKLVHDAASSSLQGGLVPIFKALENFTSEALKAHNHVRLQHPGQSS